MGQISKYSKLIALLIGLVAGLQSANAQNSVLTWTNHEKLEGKLTGASEQTLTWDSPFFVKPLEIGLDHLTAFESKIETGMPNHSFAVTLHDGGRLFGDLTGLDETTVTLTSPHTSGMRIKRDAIQRVQRLRGGNLIWSGPFGTASWDINSDDKVQAPLWRDAGGGALQNVAWEKKAKLPIDFPDRFELDMQLESPGRIEFEMVIVLHDHRLYLETWENELVFHGGGGFVKVAEFSDDVHKMSFPFFFEVERDSGTLTVSGKDGDVIGRWLMPQVRENSDIETLGELEAVTNAKNGITLTNKGPGLKLTRLRIRDWVTEEPTPNAETQGGVGVEISDGRFIEELPTSLINDALTFSTESLSLLAFQSATFPKPDETPENTEDLVDVQMADSTRFNGRLLSVDGDAIRFGAEFLEEPLQLQLAHVVRMRFDGEAKTEAPDKLDRLTIDEKTLFGNWVPAADDRLTWKIPGAKEAVRLSNKSAKQARIVRAEPVTPWAKADSLFHLASKEIAPGQLVSIEEEGESVRLRGDGFESVVFDDQQLQAIVLSPSQIRTQGFADAGWAQLRGEKGDVISKRTKTGQVDIKPGSSWGHPYFLQGHEMEFKLHNVNSYSTLMVRLFCDGVESGVNSTNLLFFRNNNRVYFGQQHSGLNQVRNQQNAEVDPQAPSTVRISWDKKSTLVRVGQARLEVTNNESAPRSGLGVIFEPGNMWNNGLRDVRVSHLKLKANPGFTWAPPVSQAVKEQALFVPRFRLESPPKHVIFAPNGDLIRGTIETTTSSLIAFRSGLDTVEIPRERAAAAVWLSTPEPEAEEEVQGDEEPKKATNEGPRVQRHWVILGNGARFRIEVEKFGPEFIEGVSELLGKCRLPVSQVHGIYRKRPEADPATLAFADWQLKNAPMPDIPGPDGDVGEDSMQGEEAPGFNLTSLEGDKYQLKKFEGKVVVLDFWATWCGPCIRAIPPLQEAIAEFPEEKVRLFAINQGETSDVIEEFLKARGWEDLEILLDTDQIVGGKYGVEGIPHTVVVGPDGKIAMVESGFRPGGADAIANVIQQLLDEEESEESTEE